MINTIVATIFSTCTATQETEQSTPYNASSHLPERKVGPKVHSAWKCKYKQRNSCTVKRLLQNQIH